MRKITTCTIVVLLALSVSLSPVAALEMDNGGVYMFRTEPSAAAMIGDALVVRPVSLVGLGVTSLVFLVGWPFAAAGGNQDVAKEKLLRDPVQFTFKRPLGDF